jgi:hypothetical protein
MLDKTFEWVRLVHPAPTDEMITQRKSIITGLLSKFDTEKDVSQACRMVTAAVAGLTPGNPIDTAFAESLVASTREHQPAFPADLTENALDLQLSALLVVGEILVRNPGKTRWTAPRALISEMAISAHQLRPIVSGQHLGSIQSEVMAQAKVVLSRAAEKARERPEISLEQLSAIPAEGDAAVLWNALKPILIKELTSIGRAAAVDRDELEVLWWIYNAYSSLFAKPLSELSAFEVGLAAATELVDRALCPAPQSICSLIRGLVADREKTGDKKGKTLDAIVQGWGIDITQSLLPSDSEVVEHVRQLPKSMPLTWIATKIADTGVISGWQDEFELKTGLRVASKVTPRTLADQIFAERTTQRLLSDVLGG